MNFNPSLIRQKFPSLDKNTIFLDNPAGTQIVKSSLDRINQYLLNYNANHEGAFKTSRESDAILHEAHQSMADFLNAESADEIIFGPNMTTMTFHISRSIARTWNSGDKIVVTRLDHDANITPWVMAAEDQGCEVIWVDFNPKHGTLNMEEMELAMEKKPRLVAVGYASNALGTINPVEQITRMAHDAGALVYIDAVQHAPHGPIDVQKLGCDFLVCSAYKFFGPHMGTLYGRYELLDELTAYRVRPAPQDPPGKFMTGTANHEGMAGVLGAMEYFEWVGETFGDKYESEFIDHFSGRKLRLKQAMTAIRDYEYSLSQALLDILAETPGVTVYGLRDTNRVTERVPTVSFTMQGWHPRRLAEELDKHSIYVWDGNYYALAVTERLGLEDSGGMVRVGPVHYNTVAEIEKFGEVLREIGEHTNFGS